MEKRSRWKCMWEIGIFFAIKFCSKWKTYIVITQMFSTSSSRYLNLDTCNLQCCSGVVKEKESMWRREGTQAHVFVNKKMHCCRSSLSCLLPVSPLNGSVKCRVTSRIVFVPKTKFHPCLYCTQNKNKVHLHHVFVI